MRITVLHQLGRRPVAFVSDDALFVEAESRRQERASKQPWVRAGWVRVLYEIADERPYWASRTALRLYKQGLREARQ